MRITTDERRTGTRIPPTTEPDGLERLAELRGISEEILRAADIQLDTGSGRHSGWWRIRYPNRTGTWKYRYRNPDPAGKPKYVDDTGAEFHLYNPLRLGPNEEEVWFAEGEFDTLALIDQGYPAIGIHGVSNVPDEDSGGRFHRTWPLLFESSRVFVMFDNDEPGLKAGRRLARILNGHVFDEWDDKYGDCNAWHRADPNGMGEALARFRSRHTSTQRMDTVDAGEVR